jgi:hypothetical protein
LPFLLEAQRSWSDSLASEYNYIAQYNTALANFEFAKGSILRFHGISLSEGPLPGCAQERAVVHERERTNALVLRERASPVPQPPCDLQRGSLGLPRLPPEGVPSLPALFQNGPNIASPQ